MARYILLRLAELYNVEVRIVPSRLGVISSISRYYYSHDCIHIWLLIRMSLKDRCMSVDVIHHLSHTSGFADSDLEV